MLSYATLRSPAAFTGITNNHRPMSHPVERNQSVTLVDTRPGAEADGALGVNHILCCYIFRVFRVIASK